MIQYLYMNKNALVGVLSVMVLIGIVFWFTKNITDDEKIDTLSKNYITTLYEIEDEMVFLNVGNINYFGNETFGDFNADGREDVAFLVTRDTEIGQRSFYAVAALNLEEGYEGMNAVFIGNNISPQSTENGENIVIVNYGTDSQLASPESATTGASTFILVSNTGLEIVGQ